MPKTWTVPATVVEITDGDTITLDLDLGWRVTMRARCRIAHINCPEARTAPGKRARDFVCTLLAPGDDVEFTSHSLDKYGRPLGTLIFGGIVPRDLGVELLNAGHAIPYEA